MLWYHGIAAFSHCHRAAMRLTQRNTLAISELARAATSELPASHHQRKKRIRRFLCNDNFSKRGGCQAVLGPFPRRPYPYAFPLYQCLVPVVCALVDAA